VLDPAAGRQVRLEQQAEARTDLLVDLGVGRSRDGDLRQDAQRQAPDRQGRDELTEADHR
jgi:hypothetical protein